MRRTRNSLYYLAGYLLAGGTGFLFFPQLSLKLFQSNGNYPDIMLQMLGMFMLSLGFVIVQFIRLRATALYSSTLIIRPMILSILVWLYVVNKDPMLLVLLAIVGIGFAVTSTCYILDRRDAEIQAGS